MPIHNSKLEVLYGSSDEYNKLSSKDPNAIYFITDLNRIIVDNTNYSGGTIDYKGHLRQASDLPVYESVDNDIHKGELYTVGESYDIYLYDQRWNKLSSLQDKSIKLSMIDSVTQDIEVGDPSTSLPTSSAVIKSINKSISEVNTKLSKYAPLDTSNKISNNYLYVDSELDSNSNNLVSNKIISTELNKKVDKLDNKGLSTNDFTDEYKAKLDLIMVASVDGGVTQANWTETNPQSPSFIQNKPNIPIVDTTINPTSNNAISNKAVATALQNINISYDAELSLTSTNAVQNNIITKALNTKVSSEVGKGLSTNDFTDEWINKINSAINTPFTEQDKLKLNGIEEGAQRHIQSDWDAGTSKFIGNGSTKEFIIESKPQVLISVSVEGSITTDYSYSVSSGTITFNTPPANQSVIYIEYNDPAAILNKPNLTQYSASEEVSSDIIAPPQSRAVYNELYHSDKIKTLNITLNNDKAVNESTIDNLNYNKYLVTLVAKHNQTDLSYSSFSLNNISTPEAILSIVGASLFYVTDDSPSIISQYSIQVMINPETKKILSVISKISTDDGTLSPTNTDKAITGITLTIRGVGSPIK